MDDVTRDSPTPAPGRRSVGGVVAGRYRVRRLLGRGASKEVFLAYDEPLDREVALAIVFGAADDVTRARVVREAQLIGRLGDHPNIITVHDVGKLEDGTPYLVMQAMKGGSLADLLARERLDLARTIRLGREIADALAHAHEHDVVHRDVKPDNVWLADDGSAALGDFGIAHRAGSERLTAEGMVVGTVHYLSPEQISGGDVGPASDLYALGATLYELVCGRPPFLAADRNHVLTQHLASAPAPPSQLEPSTPAALDALILELLDKQPEHRPPSAARVAQRLAELAGAADRADRGTTLAAPAQPRDFRRLVTVLAAGADIDDPEALHGALERCTTAIERHGGTVERYLGHTLIGFFGLTESHGDDALRAARAAADLRDAMPELRLGIESGELYLGAGSRGPTGAAIMVAGRLAERAAPGEILLGDRVRDAVGAEAGVDPASGQLIELRAEQPALARPAVTPFVGRAAELDELRGEIARVREEHACRLVTIAGEPGIGKSRLAREFLATLGDDVTVLIGRCLAYGEGTTYRALAELVRGLGGDPRARVEELLAGDEQAVRGVLSAIGESGEPAHAEEISWALRRLLERVARDGPLVVALEDIHWADGVLLDLIDHLAALSSGSPILLVCLTRPELLEQRPQWAAPQPNRALIALEALPGAQARALAEELGAGELAGRIAQRAEGNPLFVEQLVAVDAGQDTRELPVTIQGVLEARIDQLDADQRMLLQRAAVEGRTFHADALTAMLPAHAQRGVDARLVALARKGLIGADTSELAGENAFRFSHALIRDVAYAGLPKLARAEMHTFIAGWLEERSAAADEIVGYHLEQACLLSADLGRAGDREHALALRAGERFQAASDAALFRGDPASAAALLERAVRLVDSDSDAAAAGALQPALGEALYEAGDLTGASRVLDEAIAHAREPRLAARAQVEREFVRLETEASVGTAQTRRIADAVLPLLERAGDHHGLCRLWSLRAQADWTVGQAASADAAWSEAAEWARRAGDERAEFDVLGWRSTVAVFGPTPVDEAIDRCEGFRERVAASPVAVLWMLNPLASLHAMKGDFDLADQLLEEATAIRRKLGTLDFSVSHHAAYVWLLAGRPERAEVPLRAGIEQLASVGEGRILATTTAMLAQALYARGELEEAATLCRSTAATAAQDDIVTQVIWRGVESKILARDGRYGAAEALARGAVELLASTDLLSHRADALLDLAEVLQTCGRAGDAADAVQGALAAYEAKRSMIGASRARALLAAAAAGEVSPSRTRPVS